MPRCFTLLLAFIAYTSWGQAAPLTDLDFARASKIAYAIQFGDPDQHRASLEALPGFVLFDFEEDHHQKEKAGFRGVALINRETHTVIVAYRGTDPKNGLNLVVDGGLFLTLAARNPYAVTMAALGKFSLHYGTRSSVGGMTGLALVGQLASGFRVDGGLTADGALLADHAKTVALNSAFHQLGIEYDPEFPIEAHTQAIVKHALAFYDKTISNLHKEFNAGDQPSPLERFSRWSGLKEDPRASAPEGFTVYVTGHSLGGFLAQLVAARAGVEAVTFNAPGAAEYAAIHRIPVRDGSGIRNVFRQNDVVGSFGTHLGYVAKLVNFYDVPAEQTRLAAAYQAAEAKCVQQRTQQLAEDLAYYPAVMAQYEKANAQYLAALATYQTDMAAFNAQHQHRYAATQWLLRAAAGPTQPAEPAQPPKPTMAAITASIPNPLGPSNQTRAQAHYGLPQYLLNNHSLDRIIEEFQ